MWRKSPFLLSLLIRGPVSTSKGWRWTSFCSIEECTHQVKLSSLKQLNLLPNQLSICNGSKFAQIRSNWTPEPFATFTLDRLESDNKQAIIQIRRYGDKRNKDYYIDHWATKTTNSSDILLSDASGLVLLVFIVLFSLTSWLGCKNRGFNRASSLA